jgi:hypothetical protein
MEVLSKGHIYRLAHLDGQSVTEIVFVCREDGRKHEGTTNQEVIRALIDRVQYLDEQVPCYENQEILHHLRMALVLHEMRALSRKTNFGKIEPERVALGADGHFLLLQARGYAMTDIVERLRGWRHAAIRRDGSTLETMRQAADEIEAVRGERDAILADWNALVKAIGSPTHGGAVGHANALRADAERFYWLCEDHPKLETRKRVARICESIPTRSLAGVRIDIDAARHEDDAS